MIFKFSQSLSYSPQQVMLYKLKYCKSIAVVMNINLHCVNKDSSLKTQKYIKSNILGFMLEYLNNKYEVVTFKK